MQRILDQRFPNRKIRITSSNSIQQNILTTSVQSKKGRPDDPDLLRLGGVRVIKNALSVLSTSKLDQIHDLKLN